MPIPLQQSRRLQGVDESTSHRAVLIRICVEEGLESRRLLPADGPADSMGFF